MIEMRGPNLGGLVDELDRLADGQLERDLQQSLEDAAEDIKKAAVESAERILPRHGGLADRVARSRIVTRVTRNGVRLIPVVPSSIDRGVVRHPVFGRRGSSVTQQVRPGYFSRPFGGAEDSVRDKLDAVLQRIIARLDR